MTEPNDSDGSWEFVDDKDSDSETSSVASPYDTGLPDENLSTNLADSLVGSVWNNRDEFVTDSDIEACVETGESENEEEQQPVHLQEIAIEEDSKENKENIIEDTGPPENVTESMLNYKYEGPLQNQQQEEECSLRNQEMPTQQKNEDEVKASSNEKSDYDITEEQDGRDQEKLDDITSDPPLETPEDVSDMTPKSTESSDSEFEKLGTESLGSHPDVGAGDTDPRGVEEVTSDPFVPELRSNAAALQGVLSSNVTGSSDFTVVAAPSSPPVEVLTRETETNEDNLLDGHMTRSTNEEAVGMETEEVLANSRTVGMVTDHVTVHNQRFLISIVMISFGVGFLLGKTPVQPAVLTVVHETPRISRTMQVYQDMHKQPNTGETALNHERRETILPRVEVGTEILRQMQVKNAILRNQLVNEKLRLKTQNTGLRVEIQELKNKELTEQEMQERMKERLERRFVNLQKSCQRQNEVDDLAIDLLTKEVEGLEVQLENMEKKEAHSKAFLLESEMQREQHLKRLRLCRMETARLEEERDINLGLNKRLSDQVENLQMESQKMASKLEVGKSLLEGGKLVVENEPLTLSPLMRALAEKRGETTCTSGGKFESLNRRLRAKVKFQTALVRKLKRERHLQVVALESLYANRQTLSNYAMCLKRQVQSSPLERAKDPVSFCSSKTNPEPSGTQSVVPDGAPKCGFSINGTLREDLSILDLSISTRATNLTAYHIKIFRPPSTQQYFFNVTPIIYELAEARPFNSKPNLYCDLKTSENVQNVTSEESSLVPALWYRQAVALGSHARHQVTKYKRDLGRLGAICRAKQQSLESSREQLNNTKTALMLITRDFFVLEKKNWKLKEKLKNATKQAEEPTLKRCFKSALKTENIMKKLNHTKGFKAASKVAQKVKKVTKKAWRKVAKLFSKLQPKRRAQGAKDDLDDDLFENEQDERAVDVGYKMREKNYKEKKFDSNDEDLFDGESEDEGFYEAEAYHGQKIGKGIKEGRIQERNLPEEEWDEFDEFFKLDRSEKSRKYEKVGKKEFRTHPGNMKRKNEQSEDEELFERSQEVQEKWNKPRKHTENGNRRWKKQRKIEKIEKENRRDNEYQENWRRKNEKRRERPRETEFKRQTHRHSRNKRRNLDRMEELAEDFQEYFSRTIEKAKRQAASLKKKARNQLMPIYDGMKKKFCYEDFRIPDAIKDLWESREEEKEHPHHKKEKNTSQSILLGLQDLYFNISSRILPQLASLPKMVGSWGKKSTEIDAVLVPPSENDDENQDEDVGEERRQDEVGKSLEESRSSQWYAKMFEARAKLRKGEEGNDPLSDEEFDWYLRLFAARDQMRKKGVQQESDPIFKDPKDIDWYIRMFEARARLRFQNSDPREENWYLKMSDARDRARVQSSSVKGDDGWYGKMFEARGKIRGSGTGGERQERVSSEWYPESGKRREEARKGEEEHNKVCLDSSSSSVNWFLKRMKSRETERDSYRGYKNSRPCDGMVSGMNERTEKSADLDNSRKSDKISRTIVR